MPGARGAFGSKLAMCFYCTIESDRNVTRAGSYQLPFKAVLGVDFGFFFDFFKGEHLQCDKIN